MLARTKLLPLLPILSRRFYGTADVYRGTTILCVRKGPEVIMIGDGQVTKNSTMLKSDAKKVRRLNDGRVITGFAGATADAFSLLERLETQLREHRGQLLRSCIELAKMWRTDRYLRHLNATLLAADESVTLEVTGVGDVLICDDRGVMAIGSGGTYALAAARALVENTQLSAREVALKAMGVASEMCVYTNQSYTVETLANSSSPAAAQQTDDVVGC